MQKEVTALVTARALVFILVSI